MSNGVTFYFMRHGETYFNRYDRFQGWGNTPLTPEGIEEVRESGRGLQDVHFDAVYTSDLMRTIETADLILQENNHADSIELIPMYEFREVFFGHFEGLEVERFWSKINSEVGRKYDLPEGKNNQIRAFMDQTKALDPHHHAENYLEFWQRVEEGLLKLLHKHAGTNQNILVVCHGLTIRYLIHGLVADFDYEEPLKNASVSMVKYINGQFELLGYNQTDHFKALADAVSNDDELES